MWISARNTMASAAVLLCIVTQHRVSGSNVTTAKNGTNMVNTAAAPVSASGTVGTWPTGLKDTLKGDYTYAAYTPSDLVEKYHKDAFPANSDDSSAYMSSIVSRLMPLIIFGVLALLIFQIWSCATMQCCRKKKCCCAKCCGEPMKICTNKLVRTVVMVVGLVFGICIFSVAISGLANETEQYDGFDGLGGILQVMVDWSDQTVAQINTASMKCDGVSVAANNLSTHEYNSKIDGQDVSKDISKYGGLITGAMNETIKALKSINTTAGETGDAVGSSKDDVDTAVKKMNDVRASFITTAYTVVVVMILMSIVIAALKWKFPKGVGRSLRCCTGTFYCVYFIVLLVCLIVAIFISLFTFVMADFCVDADLNFMEAMKLKPTDDFAYYIQCDTNAALVNPMNNQSAEVLKSIDTANAQLSQLSILEDTLTKASDECVVPVPCSPDMKKGFKIDAANLKSNRLDLQKAISDLRFSIGSNMTQLGFDSGLLSVLNCYSLNLRYNAVLWQMCDDVYNPMALSLEFCLTIFFMLVLTDWIRRWLRPTSDELGLKGQASQVVPIPAKEQEQAYTGGEGGEQQ